MSFNFQGVPFTVTYITKLLPVVMVVEGFNVMGV